MILAGDIGGTKTLIGLFSMDAGGLRSLRQQRYASQEHASLEEILESYPQLAADAVRDALAFEGLQQAA